MRQRVAITLTGGKLKHGTVLALFVYGPANRNSLHSKDLRCLAWVDPGIQADPPRAPGCLYY
jgi:hypothetical protein